MKIAVWLKKDAVAIPFVGSAISSPVWLHWLESVSYGASLLLPIMGIPPAAYILVNTIEKWKDKRKKK